MDIWGYIAECKSEVAAIARNRDFWSNHIAFLEQNGVQPNADDVAWVERHIEGLDASREWFDNHIAEIEKQQDANRT